MQPDYFNSAYIEFTDCIKSAWSRHYYNMKRWALFTGLLLLFLPEVLRIYFVMPFPGSQILSTVDFAYWLSINIFWLRLLAFGLLLIPAIAIFRGGRTWEKVSLTAVMVSYGIV